MPDRFAPCWQDRPVHAFVTIPAPSDNPRTGGITSLVGEVSPLLDAILSAAAATILAEAREAAHMAPLTSWETLTAPPHPWSVEEDGDPWAGVTPAS